MKYNEVESFEHEGYVVGIYVDEEPDSPRNWDNLGSMACFHGRYRLGDKHEYRSPEELQGWLESPEGRAAVVLPLYLYDHGGITISTGRFSCPWDSGQVGWVYATREKILREYTPPGKPARTRLTRRLRERAEKVLRQEVATYDQYLRGDVYGYVVECAGGEHGDSCWGFYGVEYCRERAREAAEYMAKGRVEAATGAAFGEELIAAG